MSAIKKGTGDGKAPAEKSKFAQTCNRLSLFLKEKGNLRDVSLEINAKFAAAAAADPPPTTKGVSEEELYPAKATKSTTVDFLSNMKGKSENIDVPEYVILDSSSELEEDSSTHITSTSSGGSKTGQITIFYQGKVMVVDDVPEDRARYVMLVAKNGVNKLESSTTCSQISSGENKDSDLPIARRASLNKFLAKRKDRATVRAAPYHHHHQLHDHSPPPPPPPPPVVGGASSSSRKEHTFDLNK